MNVMFICGIVFLYLILIHPWRRSKNYLYLSSVSLGIFLLFLIIAFIVSNINFSSELPRPRKIEVITGGLYTVIALCICVPGIIIGFLGPIICGYSESHAAKS